MIKMVYITLIIECIYCHINETKTPVLSHLFGLIVDVC